MAKYVIADIAHTDILLLHVTNNVIEFSLLLFYRKHMDCLKKLTNRNVSRAGSTVIISSVVIRATVNYSRIFVIDGARAISGALLVKTGQVLKV